MEGWPSDKRNILKGFSKFIRDNTMKVSPWDGESKRMVEAHGPYADYLAWEAWMDKVADMPCMTGCKDDCICCRIYQLWDYSDGLERGYIYSLFCNFFSTEPKPTGKHDIGSHLHQDLGPCNSSRCDYFSEYHDGDCEKCPNKANRRTHHKCRCSTCEGTDETP